MPPWVDWIDYFGADAIGGVVGLWLRFCFSLPKRLCSRLRILSRNTSDGSADINYRKGTHSGVAGRFRSGLAKTIKIVMATLVTLVIWAIVTSKPIWTAAGADGNRILAGVLMMVSATWVISVLWISFSQPRKKQIPFGSQRRMTIRRDVSTRS
jgi:hypothetical protein